MASTTPLSISRTPPLVLGHRTALELHRSLPLLRSRPFVKGARILPDKLPRNPLRQQHLDSLAAVHAVPLPSRPIHCYARQPSRSRKGDPIVSHTCALPLPSRSLQRLSPTMFVATPELALVQIASSATTRLELLELLWEACGTYQTELTSTEALYNVKPLTSNRRIKRFSERASIFNGARKVDRALRYVSDGSASARETKLALILGLPVMYGGYGLGIPRMNYQINATSSARAVAGKKSFRADLCWPEAKLDVEYQSREIHGDENSRENDSRRANALASMGWTVVSITPAELENVHILDGIANTIRRHIGKRVRTEVQDRRSRQIRLMRQLGLAPGFRR